MDHPKIAIISTCVNPRQPGMETNDCKLNKLSGVPGGITRNLTHRNYGYIESKIEREK